MKLKNVTFVGIFAAFIAVLGLIPPIPVPLIPVPVTMQTLGVMLAGTILGRRYGFSAILVFLILVCAGLPLLPGGRGGFQVFLAPSGGYMIGWLVGAFIIGWIRNSYKKVTFLKLLIANIIGGIFTIYIIGSVQVSILTGVSYFYSVLGSLMFVPGDLLKAVIASYIGLKVYENEISKYEEI